MAYRVTVKGPFPYESRRRAGIVISAADGYEGELDKKQLAAVKADPQLTVREVSGSTSTSTDKTPPADDVPSESWTRDQLDKYAAANGIEEPEKLSSKKDVLAAIRTASAS